MNTEPGRTGGLPPPRADQWSSRPPARPSEPPPHRPRWVVPAGLVAGIVGVVGALLPAFDGQRVGDPGSTAYRIGVPLGLIGAGLALAAGSWGLTRGSAAPWHRVAAAIAVAFGSVALLLTLALVFSG